VPPLNKAELATLSKTANPVFAHSHSAYFTARHKGRMVGRIAGIINDLETEHLGERHGRFGWIDFIDDADVSAALLAAVEEWAVAHKCSYLKGPFGFDQLDRNGMLTEGFDSLGTANTIFNFPYYPAHLEALGYGPDLKWVEIDLTIGEKLPEKVVHMAHLLQERYRWRRYQPKNRRDFAELLNQLFDLILGTYAHLPGFVPISDKQRTAYIERYSRFLRPDFVHVILDSDGAPIAFGVSMPSFSYALQKARGNMLPFGFFHLMKARRWNDTAELALIGVKEEWRKKGPHGLVFLEQGKVLLKMGIHRVKINPMLEQNAHVLTLWKDFEHHVYKKRQTFIKALQ
jgi:hypothetical protein